MPLYLVRTKPGRGGFTQIDGNGCIVKAPGVVEARIAASADQPGGPGAWVDAEAILLNEVDLVINGGVLRFKTISATPCAHNWVDGPPGPPLEGTMWDGGNTAWDAGETLWDV